MRAVIDILQRLLSGYGAFFALTEPAANLLLFSTTMLNPIVGLMGALGGTLVILTRQIMELSKKDESVEIVNGILLGMLLGSTYLVNAKVVVFLAVGCLLVVAASAILRDTICHYFRLPLLGLPYVVCAFLLLPMMATVCIPAPLPTILFDFVPSAGTPLQFIAPLGSVYFHGTPSGGLLVFLAFFLGSPGLALIAAATCAVSYMVLLGLGFYPGTISFLIAQMNAVLTGAVIGGLYTTPGKRSLSVALVASGLCSILSISLERLLSVESLPALATPFVLTTYGVLIALAPYRGGAWTNFWLTIPALPEKTIEGKSLALARGISDTSISLKAPFAGTWSIYQGFNGSYTHQAAWKHALDFFVTVDEKSFKGDGRSLSDYYAYGKPVLSPCYGRVVALSATLADNIVGEVDTINNWGNFILIQIHTGAYVLLAHLQKDSIKVTLDSYVTPGQILASVGNSGRSPQPHLHMHVQESIILGSRTIPFHLSGVIWSEPTSEGKTYSLFCRPHELEMVSQPTCNAALKRALRLAVGCRHEFEVGGQLRRLEVNLDLNGQFYLQGKNDATVSFITSDDLIACFNRQGSKDLLLDAFIMSFGLTPLVEGAVSWEDKLPTRILPVSGPQSFIRCFFKPFETGLHFYYQRNWDPVTQMWIQKGQNKTKLLMGLVNWTIETEARICESLGIVNLELKLNGRCVLKAALAGYGLREDNGIPEKSALWTAKV